MTYTVNNCEQGTPEWFAARLGRVTGSKADVLMAKGAKGAESTQRINYRYELAEQRVTGIIAPQGFVSDAMKWGTEHEPFALMALEGARGYDIIRTGFFSRDDIMAGCSLDGHIGEPLRPVGIVEAKCPMLKTHIGYLKADALPDDYKWQVTHNLLVTEAEWCDFVSYRPGFSLFVVRVNAKDLPIAEYSAALETFMREVDECEAEIRRYAVAA